MSNKLSGLDELVYMVTGEDKNGDTTIFVTTDRQRADERHKTMVATYASVKARRLCPLQPLSC